MDERDIQLDEALSALTDTVIAGNPAPVTPMTKDYEQIIRSMQHLTSESPSPEFRSRLTARLNQEWDALQSAKRRQPDPQRWLTQPRFRWVALAAAVVVLTIVAALLLPGTGSLNVPGLSAGNPDLATLIVAVVLVGAAVGAVVWRRRK